MRAGGVKSAASAADGRAIRADRDRGRHLAALPPNERAALAPHDRAAQVMDALFLEQVWAGNEAMLFDLVRDQSAAGRPACITS